MNTAISGLAAAVFLGPGLRRDDGRDRAGAELLREGPAVGPGGAKIGERGSPIALGEAAAVGAGEQRVVVVMRSRKAEQGLEQAVDVGRQHPLPCGERAG